MSSRLRSLNSTKISFFAFQDIITSVSGILVLVTLILATALDRPANSTAYDANPELERKLAETLREQAEVDVQNQQLQQLLIAAETAPVAEKLERDLVRLRAQLAEEKAKHGAMAAQLAASQSALEARDRALGLTDLKAQIQRTLQEVETLHRQEAEVRREMAALEQKVGAVQSRLLKLRQWEGKLWLVPERSATTKEPILVLVSSDELKVERFDQPGQTKTFSRPDARAEFDSYLQQAKALNHYFVFFIRPSGIELFNRLVKSAREKGFEVGFDALEEGKDVYFCTPPVVDETIPVPPSAPSEYYAGSGGYSDARGRGPDVVVNYPGKGGDSGRTGGSGAAPNGAESRDYASSEGGSPGGMPAGTAQGPQDSQGRTENGRPGKGFGPTASEGNGKGRSNEVGMAQGSQGNRVDAPAAEASKKDSSKPASKPAAPPKPKPKSWWQLLLEWLASLIS